MNFRSIFLALGLALPAFSAWPSTLDNQFQIAREAFRAGDRPRLERAAAQLGGHELLPWVEYYRLRMQLETSDAETIQAFLQRHERSYVAEKLRGDWIRVLAKNKRWSEIGSEYGRLLTPEQDTQCIDLQARLQMGDKGALNEVMALWTNLLEPPESCQTVMEALIWEKRLQADHVWARIRRQFEANRLQWARQTMAYLPDSQTPDAKQLAAISERAAAYLSKPPGDWSASRLGRELVALAVQRAASNDPGFAAARLESLQRNMQTSELQWAWSQVALNAARRHLPETLQWYARAGDMPLSEEAAQWKVRAALRAGEWGVVHQTIHAMPPALATRPEWIYWQGRAHKAAGRLTEANLLFGRIAGEPHFYGNLADEELGRTISPPAKAAPLSREESSKAAANGGLQRALAFFRLDMRTEGVREWNYSLRGMSDRELLAAAELAKRSNLYDRAINTADRTQSEHDYSIRYLAPFSEQVRPAARNQSLDDAWVYGLMRQESRFITNAKSSAGASGLMQLMPATARWVAKKVGLRDYDHGRVNDTETNLLLGTSYMRMVMESLDNHPVLASAAYNAGPGRARKWQDASKPLEGAIYAESIPFSETRDYVKKVMSNSVYYSSLFTGKPESLKARLGTINARRSAPTGEDLP
mgnify:FL=1